MMMNIFENIILLVCVLDLFSIEITMGMLTFPVPAQFAMHFGIARGQTKFLP